jgi:hypothetical protein
MYVVREPAVKVLLILTPVGEVVVLMFLSSHCLLTKSKGGLIYKSQINILVSVRYFSR